MPHGVVDVSICWDYSLTLSSMVQREVKLFMASVGEERMTGKEWEDYQAAAIATPPTRSDHNIPVTPHPPPPPDIHTLIKIKIKNERR